MDGNELPALLLRHAPETSEPIPLTKGITHHVHHHQSLSRVRVFVVRNERKVTRADQNREKQIRRKHVEPATRIRRNPNILSNQTLGHVVLDEGVQVVVVGAHAVAPVELSSRSHFLGVQHTVQQGKMKRYVIVQFGIEGG